MNSKIKNIVFDVGNVLVRWDPLTVTKQHFPEHADPQALASQLFRSSTWHDLNKGLISQAELIQIYHNKVGIPVDKLQFLLEAIRDSLQPLDGSIEMLNQLYTLHYPLYALTDNTHEFVRHLKEKYDFWQLFRGATVSANIGYLKPSPEIYRNLLETHCLNPDQTIFFDDYQPNVDGAIAMGMKGFLFENAAKCLQDLKNFGLIL